FRLFKPFLDNPELSPILDMRLGEKKRKLVYSKDGKSPTKQQAVPQATRDRVVLEEAEVLAVGRWAATIEKHYGRPMDIEWAKDGKTKELFIVQARPETVQSQVGARSLNRYRLTEKGEPLLTGSAIGSAIASGPVRVLKNAQDPE